MKIKTIGKLAGKVLIAGICLCSVQSGLAATNYIIDSYPLSTGEADVTAYQHWWGSVLPTITFDPTMDANDDTNNSGSVRFDVPGLTDTGWDCEESRPLAAVVDNIGGIYGSLEFDIAWGTNSALDGNGTYAKFNNIPVNGDFSVWEWSNAAYYVPTNNPPAVVWRHVVHQFPLDFNPTTLGGWAFYLYEANTDPNGENVVRGPMTFWLDNIMFVTNSTPPAPPTLSIQKATAQSGLNEYASVFNSIGSRQSIRTVANSYGWVGSTEPVTYSFTISSFPDAAHNGFEARVWLLPVAGNETAPDHNEANCAYLRVRNTASGGALFDFRFKTNAPGTSGNSAYDPHTLGVISNSTPLGTWSVTFINDTNVTLKTPSGTTTNFNLHPDAAALFAGGNYFYLGITPNNIGNIGQSATFSGAQIVTGTTTNVSDTFSTAPLDTTVWQTIADNPNSVFVWPADATYWVSWTLPDTSFQLVGNTNLIDTGSWVEPTAAVMFQNNIRRQALLTNTVPTTSFFRLVQTNTP
jgi:hypothetical protein